MNQPKKAKPNLVQPTEGEVETEEDVETLNAGQLLAEHSRQLSDLQQRLSALETTQGAMKVFMPKDSNPLSRSEVDSVLTKTPGTWFETLADYRCGQVRFNRGKVFCAFNHDDIQGHVSGGLKIQQTKAPH